MSLASNGESSRRPSGRGSFPAQRSTALCIKMEIIRHVWLRHYRESKRRNGRPGPLTADGHEPSRPPRADRLPFRLRPGSPLGGRRPLQHRPAGVGPVGRRGHEYAGALVPGPSRFRRPVHPPKRAPRRADKARQSRADRRQWTMGPAARGRRQCRHSGPDRRRPLLSSAPVSWTAGGTACSSSSWRPPTDFRLLGTT